MARKKERNRERILLSIELILSHAFGIMHATKKFSHQILYLITKINIPCFTMLCCQP